MLCMPPFPGGPAPPATPGMFEWVEEGIAAPSAHCGVANLIRGTTLRQRLGPRGCADPVGLATYVPFRAYVVRQLAGYTLYEDPQHSDQSDEDAGTCPCARVGYSRVHTHLHRDCATGSPSCARCEIRYALRNRAHERSARGEQASRAGEHVVRRLLASGRIPGRERAVAVDVTRYTG